ncbi:MAG: tRNA 4-thiouridine(8) synthase ThiI [candidate division NC10 bacterium RIFCSPLOWO2_12_FULL_66_18]|nr:MAG: tRNA 4-thiouridine(8) synthase ThiI [candidate division NC10 bacterium RIFCSPLOWO2_12_FULL_66_18]
MRCVMIHYNEIGLKGKNQPLFLRRLEANLLRATDGAGVRRVEQRSGRMVLRLSREADWEAIRGRLRTVFGVANFSLAERVEPDMAALKAAMGKALEGRTFRSFKVAARRAFKQFPLTSEDINRELGAFVQGQTHAAVNLDQPEFTIHVEVLPRDLYFSCGREAGPGGLPVGVSGRVVSLLSGGIDSPVASHRLMKRGCQVVFVHFHSFPFLDSTSRTKAVELVQLLTRFQYWSHLYLVPFGEIQREVVVGAPAPLRVVLYRRLMGRIAEQIARREQAKALVTGESLGQVASQTLENLAVIEEAVGMPVLRPLIGSDKEEIVQQARALGTYDISIIPDQDCCRLFVPRHPATFSSLDEVRAVESQLPIEKLVQMGLDQMEIQAFEFPESSRQNSASAGLTVPPRRQNAEGGRQEELEDRERDPSPDFDLED